MSDGLLVMFSAICAFVIVWSLIYRNRDGR